MKVKNAAQVFSHRVQSTMRGLVRHGNNVLPPEAIGTANFLLFVDKLFDKVNGSSLQPKDGKHLRRAVTTKTEYVDFWNESIRVLESVKYFTHSKEFVPPTITNWILSLRNLKLLWSQLQRFGFEFLCTRNLNQDPLENFFSCVRSHGARNINPSCNAFRATFKSLIVNNFLTRHSPSANCEEDDTEGVLSGLKIFLEADGNTSQENQSVIPSNYADNKIINLKLLKGDIVLKVHGYVAGAMAKKLLKLVKDCEVCRTELKTEITSDEHGLIEDREYRRNALLRPRTKFVVLFGFCNQVVRHFLPLICEEKDLKTKLILLLNNNISRDIFNVCDAHNLFQMFLHNFVTLYCFTWVTNVNRILKGTISNTMKDPIKEQAQALHHRNRKRYDKVKRSKHLV